MPVENFLFQVDTAPVEAVIGRKSHTRRVAIPGKKALLNAVIRLSSFAQSHDKETAHSCAVRQRDRNVPSPWRHAETRKGGQSD
jgi:hypothetical protein